MSLLSQETPSICGGNGSNFESNSTVDNSVSGNGSSILAHSTQEKAIREIIASIGDDPDREGLLDTPRRVVKSWRELFAGYKTDPAEIMRTFTEGSCDEMVLLRDVEFYSTCEHHMIPFFGRLHIGYIPDGRVLGVSKLARVAEVFARRLQIQERLTAQIADTLSEYLRPRGVMVVCEAQHLCMVARGVNKQHSVMVTSAVRGVFKDDIRARDEFLRLMEGRK